MERIPMAWLCELVVCRSGDDDGPQPADRIIIEDALRLSQGMTWKNALAELPFGGGKAVVRSTGDPRKKPDQLRAFGRFVNMFGGRYITAEDVGIGVDDIEAIAQVSLHVAGRALGTAGGDPSPKTALGVLLGIRAAAAHRLGRGDLAGTRVAVQGLGAVGMTLCEFLHREGVRLVVADLDPASTSRAREALGAEVVAPGAILDADVDVFSPCALGGVLDDDAIGRLRAVVVAGAANNQLAEPRHGDALHERGILYAPDYLVNAGGIINIGVELMGSYSEESSIREVSKIEDRAKRIFARADREGSTPERVADALVRERLRLGT
jgi:leucine dehydrogenase